MSLRHIRTDAIAESQLGELITQQAREIRELEFKQAVELATDDQKREFLSDVTAFANTDGGDLLFGMKASDGVASELVGLRNFVPDRVIGTMENLIRDAVQPRLPGVEFRTISLANGNAALLVRIPRSFAAPHMVRHCGVTRFCGRNSNGKYDLDVFELRTSFLANEGLADRLRSFRLDRINRLIGDTIAPQMSSNHLLVVHVLPVVSARPGTRLANEDLRRFIDHAKLKPMGDPYSWGGRFTFDGVSVASSTPKGQFDSVVQVFRSGFLEALNATILQTRPQGPDGVESRLIPGVAWESCILQALSRYLQVLAEAGVGPPSVVGLALLNVRGYVMAMDFHRTPHGSRAVDQDHLLTDEVVIEDGSPDLGRVLRPLFDQVWNACGWSGSPNYNESGGWGVSGR